jgi:hypothetical protein
MSERASEKSATRLSSKQDETTAKAHLANSSTGSVLMSSSMPFFCRLLFLRCCCLVVFLRFLVGCSPSLLLSSWSSSCSLSDATL